MRPPALLTLLLAGAAAQTAKSKDGKDGGIGSLFGRAKSTVIKSLEEKEAVRKNKTDLFGKLGSKLEDKVATIQANEKNEKKTEEKGGKLLGERQPSFGEGKEKNIIGKLEGEGSGRQPGGRRPSGGQDGEGSGRQPGGRRPNVGQDGKGSGRQPGSKPSTGQIGSNRPKPGGNQETGKGKGSGRKPGNNPLTIKEKPGNKNKTGSGKRKRQKAKKEWYSTDVGASCDATSEFETWQTSPLTNLCTSDSAEEQCICVRKKGKNRVKQVCGKCVSTFKPTSVNGKKLNRK